MDLISAESALDALLAAYESIAASRYRDLAPDQPLVGIVGGAVPREVFHGFGVTPVHLAGLERSRENVAEFMEESAPWHWQGIAEGMLRGHYRDFAAVVLDRSHQHFYYYLKEMQRQGAGRAFPPVLILDWIQSSDQDHSRYHSAQVRAFASALERISGQPYDPELTTIAVHECNRMRATLRAFQAFRCSANLPASVAYRLMAASHAMRPARHRELLTAVMRTGVAAGAGAPRALLVSSDSMMSLHLHEAAAAAGAVVVAEDDWWGARSAHRDAPTTGSIADLCTFQASLGIGEFVAPMTKRTAWYRDAAHFKGVDFAVLHHSSNDQHAGWDTPAIIEALARHAIPSVCIEGELQTSAGRTQVAATIRRTIDSRPGTGR